ncbi:hypothetical protein Xmau_02095 [Xenorhabdus mauleonii]|uniref:Uncharacterized protein n=1 Tax=Xenorhabdus mauleonii TaxID=351675 RepID=A0A1I3HNU9_9GAMM|nr:hypothetical protein [Xenorhabdus mauleonii]PHM40334.1 hypothetical protein Xmau_02095 [Xenorhabdus mauleonii]SFI37190.1 hypothetical protein SAMN05421680_1013 [Xenorhabdus mauleonii]
MTIEQILQNTMREAQSIFKGKSHNISYYDINILPKEKRKPYTEKEMERRVNSFRKLQEELLIIRYSSEKIYNELISERSRNLVGNCFFLSIFVLQHFIKTYKQRLCQLFYPPDIDLSKLTSLLSLQLIVTNKPYNHVFVLICPPSYILPQRTIGEKYNPNEFPKGAWVCDPWANIVCPAHDYNNAWKFRMAEWNAKGKTVLIERTKTKYNENLNYSPLGFYNYMAIQESKKNIDEIIILYPDGKTKTKNSHSSSICNLI